ncbi:hypothetical protein EDC96DRAFT_574879 [Choanephora cucurbitarum]|nr:hypothetical protein EDC96DRAFT_574879 [Choanephora cucurbitarum]
MKFSSALISASLLATAVFAAPEPHASASASASQVSAASASAVSAASVAEASIIASMLEATDANASMDIAQLFFQKRADDDDDKDWDHDDDKDWDHDDHHDDKKKDDVYIVLDKHTGEDDVCKLIRQEFYADKKFDPFVTSSDLITGNFNFGFGSNSRRFNFVTILQRLARRLPEALRVPDLAIQFTSALAQLEGNDPAARRNRVLVSLINLFGRISELCIEQDHRKFGSKKYEHNEHDSHKHASH